MAFGANSIRSQKTTRPLFDLKDPEAGKLLADEIFTSDASMVASKRKVHWQIWYV
jgi:hypothetical protein